MKDMCKIRWNPGRWPYVTHCAMPKGHEGDHINSQGRTCPNLPEQVEDEET